MVPTASGARSRASFAPGLAGSALIVAALYFARAILLPIALAESGDRPPDSRAERSGRALHDLVACAVVFFQPQCVHGSPSRSR